MVGCDTIVMALSFMWESEVKRAQHGRKADAGVQYEMTGDTLRAWEYIGDWESHTVYTMCLSGDALAGFRRAVSLCEGKTDPEFIDQRLKGMIAASCEKYNGRAAGRLLGLCLSPCAGALLMVALSAGKSGGVPPWALLAGIAVCGLGLLLTYRPWKNPREFWAGCSLETEEDTLRSLEKLEAYLRK